MMTGRKMKAARALSGIDQGDLAGLSGVSLKTIRSMEATPGVVRANVDTLMDVVDTLDGAGLVLISADSATVEGGRGIQLKSSE
jgi:DNA-binding XRE family transcriptional regulator